MRNHFSEIVRTKVALNSQTNFLHQGSAIPIKFASVRGAENLLNRKLNRPLITRLGQFEQRVVRDAITAVQVQFTQEERVSMLTNHPAEII